MSSSPHRLGDPPPLAPPVVDLTPPSPPPDLQGPISPRTRTYPLSPPPNTQASTHRPPFLPLTADPPPLFPPPTHRPPLPLLSPDHLAEVLLRLLPADNSPSDLSSYEEQSRLAQALYPLSWDIHYRPSFR